MNTRAPAAPAAPAARVKRVEPEDLPISCPPCKADSSLHPRVFLPISVDAESVSCPYCGTRYALSHPESDEQGV